MTLVLEDVECLAEEDAVKVERSGGDRSRSSLRVRLDAGSQFELQRLSLLPEALCGRNGGEEGVACRFDGAIDVPRLRQVDRRRHREFASVRAECVAPEPDDGSLREFPQAVQA